MISSNCRDIMTKKQDGDFFSSDEHKKVCLHIIRNEDMDSIYRADNDTDNACEEFHGNTVHFIT